MNKMSKLSEYFHQRDRGWLLSLIAAVFIVYLPYLGNPLVFDDLTFFSNGAIAIYADKGFDFDLRWLPYASLGWTYAIFDDVHTHFFRAGNVLLHTVNVILLFYLLRQLTSLALQNNEHQQAANWGAWFGAVIFAVHPVAVFATGYVIQRSIVMATLFVLVMQLTYLRALLTGQKRWLVLSALAYFGACFSKEHSVLSPILLVAFTLSLRVENRFSKRAMWLTWGAYLAIAVLVILRARGVLGSPYEAMAVELFEQQGIVESTPMLHVLSALTQAGLFFKYMLLWALPDPSLMSIDMRETFVSSLEAWQGWLGLASFTAYGVVAIRLLLLGGARSLLGFALLYPWFQFCVELVVIRVQEPFVLYRSYLWMPGVLLLIPLILIKWPERRTWVLLICGVLLLIPLAWNRLSLFGDNLRLWNNAVDLLKNDRVAGADRIYYNRGQALMAERKWELAASDFERAVNISPQLGPVHYILGVAYTNAGRYKEALTQYDLAINITPEDERIYFAKGMTLKRLNFDKEAMQQMVISCKLHNSVACLISSGAMRSK
jgi:hypothetical protein